MQVGPNSILRGAGAAVACLLSGPGARGAVLATSYAAAGTIDPAGIQVVAIAAHEDGGPLHARFIPLATATASWVTVQSLVIAGLRRLPLPPYAVAVAWGAVVVAADVAVSRTSLHQPPAEVPPSATR